MKNRTGEKNALDSFVCKVDILDQLCEHEKRDERKK